MTGAGRHSRRSSGMVALSVALGGTLAACGADATDFQRSAEDFIESDTMAGQAGTKFAGARCDEPASTSKGTTFRCTAIAKDGTTWQFEVAIVDDTNFEITGRPSSTGGG